MTEHVELEDSSMVLCKLVSSGEEVLFNLRDNSDFSWSLLLLGEHINVVVVLCRCS